MTIDLGAGDGRAVLARAAREPGTLVLGVDAVAAAMSEASRRAARSPTRGGLPNARFVVAAAEDPPAELHGLAAEVTVNLPWGSLLRGCLGADEVVAAGIATLVATGGRLELLLAPAERDRLAGLPTEPAATVAFAAAAFAAHELRLEVGRPASEDEIRASGSTWARRLLAVDRRAERSVLLVRLRRSRA